MNENPHRKEKMTDVIKEAASQFIQKESNKDSMITVTRVELSSDLKKAIVLFTVLPDNKEQAVLDFLKRNRSDFRLYINKETKIGQLPWFDFEIDEGEKSRQKIDTII
jgi:ribosome-binding factor A